ncbi:hypothetical protein OQN32_25590 (plasmid) [Rhodococcus pyridinivorans]|nr:hypothetical protein [Rhodococcus pyridinivorans]WAL49082.1 hypothetical protein OQN32_25590 [Rhodococcus pyridinivorans]
MASFHMNPTNGTSVPNSVHFVGYKPTKCTLEMYMLSCGWLMVEVVALNDAHRLVEEIIGNLCRFAALVMPPGNRVEHADRAQLGCPRIGGTKRSAGDAGINHLDEFCADASGGE